MPHSLKRVKNELIHSQYDIASLLLFITPTDHRSLHDQRERFLIAPLSIMRLLEHKTQLWGNFDDLCNLDCGRLELLCIAKLAIRVEDLWSKDIIDLPCSHNNGDIFTRLG